MLRAADAAERALAEALIDAGRSATLLPPPSQAQPGLTLEAAWRVAGEVEHRLITAGRRPAGWKIGFTNRGIWPRYGVHQPIWGRVWDHTLTLLEGTQAEPSLAGLVQPRIEPEIVFGFAQAPRAGMTADELPEVLDWVAHGIEIVHTHYEGWRFGTAADPVADGGLHGRLVVGPRIAVRDGAGLRAALAALRVTLCRDGTVVDQGQGSAVLDGPLDALSTWLAAMAVSTPGWQVRAGDVVTTGTLTDAWPVAPGEHWTTTFDDPGVPGLSLRFTA